MPILKNPKIRRIRQVIWSNVLWIVWATWWGGLSFYAIVVIPIGTELIGSVEQGFISQKVTQWHNWLSLLFVMFLAIDAHVRRRGTLWIIVALLVFINIMLVVWHSILSSQMDFEQKTVPSGFYAQHAVYLWFTAAQWIVGMAMPLFLLPIGTRRDPFERQGSESIP